MNSMYRETYRPYGGYLGTLGADDVDRARPWFMSILDGSMYNELKEKRYQQKLNNVKVVEMSMAIDKINNASEQQRLRQQWVQLDAKNRELQRKIEDAANKYDAVVSDIRTYSGGVIAPQFLGAIQAAVIAPILAATAFALLALAATIVALRADFSAFAKMSESLEQGIGHFAKAGKDVPEAMSSWMRNSLFVAAGGLALFMAYKVFSQWEKGKTTFELPRFVKSDASASPAIAEVAP